MLTSIQRGLGWRPDLADRRDYTPGAGEVDRLLRQAGEHAGSELPDSVDLREFCAPVSDQRQLQSASAHACVAVAEYFERRASGRLLAASPMFLHQMTRRLLRENADGGADLRTTLKALVRFGLPPERYWPHTAENYGRQPDAFLYGFARDYRAIRYVRLDVAGRSGESTLHDVRRFLAAGFACAFGFSAFSSLSHDADIPFPTGLDALCGGHAVAAIGYDDKRRIRSDRGALLVRNSWGEGWGDHGYGWLPYAYVRELLARDFWTLVRPRWLRSGEFHLPA